LFKTISNFMRVKDIRNKIIFTLLMLIVFRLGSFIPVPHVNTEVLKAQDQMSVFGIPKHIWRRCIFNFSILAMGIMPYITASIIIQLLQMDVVPKFTEWSKQGKLVAEN
jgi:preprotein translocase subunit SecY